MVFAGCCMSPSYDDCRIDYQAFHKDIEYPDAEIAPELHGDLAPPPPPTVRRFEELEPWPMSLEEAIHLALQNSEVIRRIGGRAVAAPSALATVYDQAIVESSPRIGPEAALAAFDAQFFSRLESQRVEGRANLGGLAGDFLDITVGRTTTDFGLGIGKVAATGTEFSVGHGVRHEHTNSRNRAFVDTWNTALEASFRHPLMQGGGILFNRIAGPGATAGNYRGILIARINSDISLADFEAAVRQLVRDVELAYWGLYFTYRDLDAVLTGRELALEAWQLEKQRVDAHMRPADQEAFVREQYYLAQSGVENSLSGREGSPGIYSVERQLRNLLGLPASDGRLIRPTDNPLRADIQFDWQQSLDSALVRRVELRKQRWRIKQRELELIAARNFGKVKLDLTGEYHVNGFGNDLFGPYDEDGPAAYSDMFEGSLQGWTLGIELNTPIGNRLGHAAIKNAELMLRREQALMRQQELEISYELRDAFTELDRAYAVTRSNYNRYVAARIQLEAERKRNAAGVARLDLVLDAQRRFVQSEVLFHRAILDYNLALINMHYARGTLLDSLGVYLTEGPWSEEAHALAERESRRYRYRCHATGRVVPSPVSVGSYLQRVEEIPAPEGVIEDDTMLEEPLPLPADVPAEPEADARRLPPPIPDNMP
jgi:hypothetical protein